MTAILLVTFRVSAKGTPDKLVAGVMHYLLTRLAAEAGVRQAFAYVNAEPDIAERLLIMVFDNLAALNQFVRSKDYQVLMSRLDEAGCEDVTVRSWNR